MCLRVHGVGMGAHRCQKRASDSLGLEFQVSFEQPEVGVGFKLDSSG